MKVSKRLSDYLSEYLCDIHTLELVIKDGFKNTNRMLDVLKTTKKIAKYVQKSSVGTRELKDACDQFNIKFLKPVNPPLTRWSGFFKNLSSVLNLKKSKRNRLGLKKLEYLVKLKENQQHIINSKADSDYECSHQK